MKTGWAILYLDTLEMTEFGSRDVFKSNLSGATFRQRPFITFERRERMGHRFPVWHPCETRFFDASGKAGNRE